MTRQRAFIQCDVFTSTPMYGNALAVVLDGNELSDETMAAFAAWTNLAETTFITSPTHPDADYRLRIFTPNREMPFAGHPTLGSCAAWLRAGGTPKLNGTVRQECAIGIVDIELGGDVPAFVAPPTLIEELPATDQDRLIEKLALRPDSIVSSARLNNGPVWQVFELSSAIEVLAVDSSRLRWPDETPVGLIGAHKPGTECDYEVRMLAPSSGMSEDPITGSLNAALAYWFVERQKLHDSIVVAQGTCINRQGRVHICRESHGEHRILIGGESHILIEGSVLL